MGTDHIADDEKVRSTRAVNEAAEGAISTDGGLQVESSEVALSRSLLSDKRVNMRVNAPVKEAALQGMQQAYGNRAVQRMVTAQRFSTGEEDQLNVGAGTAVTAPTPASPPQAQEPVHESNRSSGKSGGISEGDANQLVPSQDAAQDAAQGRDGSLEVEEPERRQSSQDPNAGDDQQNGDDNVPSKDTRFFTALPGTVFELGQPLAGPGGLVAVNRLTVVGGRLAMFQVGDGDLTIAIGNISVAAPLQTDDGRITNELLVVFGRLQRQGSSPLVSIPGIIDLAGGSLSLGTVVQPFTGQPIVPGQDSGSAGRRIAPTVSVVGGHVVAVERS